MNASAVLDIITSREEIDINLKRGEGLHAKAGKEYLDDIAHRVISLIQTRKPTTRTHYHPMLKTERAALSLEK